jgi:hypothetical protein
LLPIQHGIINVSLCYQMVPILGELARKEKLDKVQL